MEVPPRVNSVLAKRLWNFLRIAYYMMRKGLVSKRKLIMDMNMMMKRGKVLGKKTLGNLIHHHHHHSSARAPVRGYGLQEYEFSCSNSPNPVFFHVGKRKHHYFSSITHFPCINVQDEPEEENPPAPKAVIPVHKIEYTSPEYSFNVRLDGSYLAHGEKLSPMLSPFSVRVSNYSGVEEADGGSTPQVDAEAEEFIKRFYEQLRVQNRTALLQYQETEYKEMLARGC
ncbi:uncharacterized protein [Aristolochia californica]|uniref:uncharacterized protein n=1 Tax=Aristolochia californica TaxID=171875 RepID=UPI0035DD65EE